MPGIHREHDPNYPDHRAGYGRGAVDLGIHAENSTHRASVCESCSRNLVSSLSTNGKVEPLQWASARAERAGIVDKVFVQKGQQVHSGDELISLDMSDATAQLATANAAIAAAQAEGQVLKQGGPQLQRTQITSDLASARANLQNAQKEYEALQRLVDKQAATRVELEVARQEVEQAQLQIDALDRRRSALVSDTELPVVRAKLEEAEGIRGPGAAKPRAERSAGAHGWNRDQFDLRLGSSCPAGPSRGRTGRRPAPCARTSRTTA